VTALAAALVVVAAACGGDNTGSSSGATTTAAAGSATTTATTAASTATTAAGVATTTATATSKTPTSADASKSPVKVGFATVDQGSVGLPGSTAGAEAAEKYINAELGGINGHPIDIVVCHVDLEPQTNQACGQQFANDADMHVVNAGWMFNGGSFYSALTASGKPIMGSIPLNDADYKSQAFFWSPGQLIQRANAQLAMLKAPGAKSIGMFRQDNATGQTSEDSVRSALQSIAPDVKLNVALVAAGSTDLIGAASQLGAQDLYMVNLNGPGCIQALQALQSVDPGKPIVAGAACVNDNVISQVGKEAVEGIYFASNSEIVTATSGLSADATTFNEKYPKYGDATYKVDPFAAQEWGLILSLRNVLAGLSDSQLADKAALTQAIESFKGPVVLGSPTVACPGSVQKQVCGTSVRAYEAKDGKASPLPGANAVIDVNE
jgi:branched-chain amino acid transport system substrate-binding protein